MEIGQVDSAGSSPKVVVYQQEHGSFIHLFIHSGF